MKQAKLLIVDDDPELRRAFARTLGGDGHLVEEATTVAEALEATARVRPDLVLLKAELPGADVLDLCRRLKAEPAPGRAFVIMTSGRRASSESQAAALEAGADGFLAGPIDPQALKAHVSAFLRIRRGEEELRESERRYRSQAEELREANRRLEEYNRLKAEFVANMSHELRTPLTAIIGFAQLVQLGQEGGTHLPARYADAFERIQRNGQHLLALINDVLDVSKIEAGRMQIHREHIDLVQVVQGAFAELQSLAERRSIAYRLRVPERLPLAFTDPLRVRQVVINLLSNAIKFTAHGSVEVELRACGDDQCCIVVSDTGIGIQEESLGIIFERFRQVDGSSTRTASGVGLGLSIVRQITELLGGRVEVNSKPGEGSTFTVTLPMSAPVATEERESDLAPAEAPESAAAGQPSETAAEPGHQMRPLVIVIEDDPDAAALLSETLRQTGYRVLAAANGSEGLRLARAHDPVAVTLDVMMPGMDGWRVLREMKSDRRMARIPVIVCSIVDNRPLGYSLGASDYLLKPVDPGRLMQALDNISLRRGEAVGGYVLVVDDEHGVRELLTTALKQAGFEAHSAASGETALKMVAQAAPRAILSDLMMPTGMSGFEFIARLRSDERTAHIPVVIITGKDLTPEDRGFMAGQIADVIRKGELLMSEIAPRLRATLEGIGVTPADEEDTAH